MPRLAFFTGSNDDLADPIDMQILIKALKPDLITFLHNEESYQHLDFNWVSVFI